MNWYYGGGGGQIWYQCNKLIPNAPELRNAHLLTHKLSWHRSWRNLIFWVMQRTVLERELNPAPVPAPSSASKVPEHKQPHPDQKSNVTCQVVLLLDIFEQCSLISLSWKSQTYGFYFDWIRNLLEPYTTPQRKM